MSKQEQEEKEKEEDIEEEELNPNDDKNWDSVEQKSCSRAD